jgi:hypothetical protein
MNKAASALRRALVVAVAGLALAACDQKPTPQAVGNDLDRAMGKAGDALEKAGDLAQEKLHEAGKAVADKTPEAAATADDLTLAARVKTALIAEPNVKARDVNVETKNGVVSLYGKADSGEAKALAEKVASGVEGVKSVSNRLVVAGS